MYERVQNGETITRLARKLEMNSLLLSNWIKELDTIDNVIKIKQVHNVENEIWKKMYLKVAYKLEQLENQKAES